MTFVTDIARVQVRSLTRRDGLAPFFVSHVSERTSYTALRVCPRVDADAWWLAVRRRDDVPHAIAALLGGRARIELTREEAGQALAWARSIEGWPSTDAKPLFVYPQNTVGEPANSETG